MKFYPCDWRSDAALRAVSSAARGLWIDLLSLMHEAEPYGHLVINGTAIEPRIIAKTTGNSPRNVREWLGELERAGVFSRTKDDVIYSRRMVRDFAQAVVDKENGRHGGNPNIRRKSNGGVNPPPNPEDNGQDKAQKLEARIQSKKERGNPAGSSHAPARATPRRRLPEGWEPNGGSIGLGLDQGLTQDDIHAEAEKMRDWARHRGEMGADWDARFNNWLRKEASDRLLRRKRIEKPTLQQEWGLGSFLAPGGYVAPDFDDEPPIRPSVLLS